MPPDSNPGRNLAKRLFGHPCTKGALKKKIAPTAFFVAVGANLFFNAPYVPNSLRFAHAVHFAHGRQGRRSGQSVTASDFGSNGPRFESGCGRCVESLDKALYSQCPKEKPSH